MTSGGDPTNAISSSQNSAGSEGRAEDSAQQQLMHFKDENSGDCLSYNPITDSSFYNAYRANADLADFMKRPVVIFNTTWNDNTNIDFSFSPWSLYFNHPTIKRKLDNYKLLSCNLKIKVMINASPFYYGYAIVNYRPLIQYNGGIIFNNPALDPIPLSQRPHIWLYPQCNQGGEMVLPFFYNQDWLEATNDNDLSSMGSLQIFSYTALKNANGIVGTGVTIQVLAYAEDVCVAGPTYALAAQAGDEYSDDGPVSKPASVVAKATGMMASVPLIGPFMKATSSVADKVSQVASWFGFTNVPIIEDVVPFKDVPFHGFSSSEISQPIEKLTLDPKNELTVDPRVAGLNGVDEMGIANIASRESYLTQFAWESTRVAGDTLFLMNVSPHLYDFIPIGPTNIDYQISSTPMGHICRMFKYWRGDIVVRFKFICSKYHKGRAVIFWDPIEFDTTVDPLLFMSTNYNRIVDISEEPDVEIRIPYMQATAWLENQRTIPRTEFSSVVANVDPVNNVNYNGQIGVVVYTNQTSPVADAEVRVMVSVRAADNFELAVPTEINQNLSPFFPQYNLQVQSGDYEFGDVTEENLSGDSGKTDDPNSNLVYMGEVITSLRQVLRRTSMVRALAFNGSTADFYSIFQSLQGRVPYSYGYDPAGVQVANALNTNTGSFPFNWVKVHPLAYVMNMFVGHRGAIHWHFNVDGDGTTRSIAISRRLRSRTPALDSEILPVGLDTDDRLSRLPTINMSSGSGAMMLTNQLTQTGSSVASPFFSRFRFWPTAPVQASTGDDGSDEWIQDSIQIQSTNHPNVLGADGYFHTYCSIGTDFSLLFFLNVPTVILYSVIPTAP